MAQFKKSTQPKKRSATKADVVSAPAAKKSKAEAAGKIRAVPITTKIASPPANEELDEGQDEEERDEDEGSDVDVGATMEVDKPPKDPQASREGHRVQKELQAQRRAVKPHHALLTEAKRVWALARKTDISRTERQKYITELMDVLRGNVQDIMFKHDASRVVQTLVKHGGQKERDEVAAELKGKYRDLAQNKYGKFLVTKLIRYCKTQRATILSEFHTHVIRLLLHREASPILADAYDLHASAAERNLLLRDFYGKEVALFDSASIQKAGLRGALENAAPERRRRVLSAVAESLLLIFNNPDKGAVSHAIVHRVLWEYLAELALLEETEKDEAERLRREMFDSCQELLAEMVHTKDGSRAVREFVARGGAKDRKQIIKILKPHVEKMCTDEEAQLVLFTIFDLVDDTKLVGKSLVADISALSSTFSKNVGRRVLLYLLAPRSPRHFAPDLLKIIAQTDFAQGTTSKKDVSVRRSELLTVASAGMVKAVEENAEALVRDKASSGFVGDVMFFAEGDKSKALDALMIPISIPYTPPAPNADADGDVDSDASEPAAQTHILNLTHASRLYKTLIQGGYYDKKLKRTERAEHAPKGVARAFMHAAGKDNTVAMALGEGTFIVAELMDKLKEEGHDEELKELRSWFGKDVRGTLSKGDVRGSAVLLERLNA